MAEIKTEINYSRYDRMCLKISDFFKMIGRGLGFVWDCVSYWCEEHYRFCWTMFIGTVIAIAVALYAGNQGEETVFLTYSNIGYTRHFFSWTYCLVAGGIAEFVTVLVGIVMLFCDRAEVLAFEEYCRSHKVNEEG